MKTESKGNLYPEHLLEDKNIELMMSACLDGGDGFANFEELLAQLEMLKCSLHGHERIRLEVIIAHVESAKDKLESMYDFRKIVPEKSLK